MKMLKPAAAALCAGLMIAMAVALTLPAKPALAHCQIPCGIYDDQMRIQMLGEHITTVEKSMNLVNELSADPGKNANQLVRWVMNKEDHADQLADIVVKYFLQQRVKPTDVRSGDEWDCHVTKVRLCHEMLVASMKAKQTTDKQHVDKLRKLVDEFAHAYFTPEQLAHMKHQH
ncbi:MAG: superoxide dismutase [bacterium]|nr:superoxide dismutase [bacterium]